MPFGPLLTGATATPHAGEQKDNKSDEKHRNREHITKKVKKIPKYLKHWALEPPSSKVLNEFRGIYFWWIFDLRNGPLIC